MQTNREDIIYIAGLFDGEGHITISKNVYKNKKWNPAYYLSIGITNTDKQILEWIKVIVGTGRVRLNSKAKTIGNSQNCYSWLATAKQAKFVLELLYPFLKIKKDRAMLGIEFQKRMKRIVNQIPVSKEEIMLRERTRLKVRELNGRSGKKYSGE